MTSDDRRRSIAIPTQAVILAGGRGLRLRPLTDTVPKPMVEFHGRPFLEYLVESLRDQGITRILLLLGYKAEVIPRHFADGRRWGVALDYSVSSEDDETGRRLRLALDRLDEVFLLLYCDNYWPLRLADMWERFVEVDARAMVTVYRNRDAYSRDNVRVDADGYVVAYDRTRSGSGLGGVEIGYALLTRGVIENAPAENFSFEGVIYPQLIERRHLRAYLTDHRYYSIGSPERLPLTAEFLSRTPAVILDRDGVLNRRPPRARYVRAWSEFEWLPGAREALRTFATAGYRVIVVTNQPGIARGELTERDLADIHERMRGEAFDAGGRIDALYRCPHDWDEGCECRKPRPGLLFEAQHDFNLDLTRTPFIGDDDRDGLAAAAAGCPFRQVTADVDLLAHAKELFAASAHRELIR